MHRKDVALRHASQVARRRFYACKGGGNLLGIAPAGIGQDDGAMNPVEELHAELFLQELDLMAYRRGRDKQLLGRQGERRQARGRLEGLYSFERNPIRHRFIA